MGIDRVALAEELRQLRDLARIKWEEDPLPTGREACQHRRTWLSTILKLVFSRED